MNKPPVLYGVTLTNPDDKVCDCCGTVIHPENAHVVTHDKKVYCYPCYIKKGR